MITKEGCMKDVKILTLLVAVAMLFAFACAPAEEETYTAETELAEDFDTETTTPTDGDVVTVAQIMENPTAYENREVTVVGEVEEVYGDRAFKIDEEGLFTGGIDNDLLVIAGPGVTWIEDQIHEETVRTTGTVRMFSAASFGQEFDYDFTADTFRDYEGRPVLVARSVTPENEDQTNLQADAR
jgi:hypothetical protein